MILTDASRQISAQVGSKSSAYRTRPIVATLRSEERIREVAAVVCTLRDAGSSGIQLAVISETLCLADDFYSYVRIKFLQRGDMELSSAMGKLLLIGGAEDKDGDCTILREFVRLAKGARARIVVMTVATDHPKESGEEYTKLFKKLGADDVQALDVTQRDDAQDEKRVEAIKRATGIFFTGGDQLHITALMGATEMDKAIRARCEKGAILAGTSAGAAMMSNSMFIRGSSDSNPRFGSIDLGPGMDYIMGAVIDTHFSQRGRIGRLMTAVAHYPQDMGLGIDENTALLVEGDKCTVLGEGAVTVVDGSALTFSNLPYVRQDESLALFDIKVHVLPAGCGLSLAERTPFCAKAAKANEK
jgi:cyanophycinase